MYVYYSGNSKAERSASASNKYTSNTTTSTINNNSNSSISNNNSSRKLSNTSAPSTATMVPMVKRRPSTCGAPARSGMIQMKYNSTTLHQKSKVIYMFIILSNHKYLS